MTALATWQNKDLLLAINLQPRAAKDEFIATVSTPIKIRLTAPPTNNEANNQLIKFVAKAFGVTQAEVTIEQGRRSRKKLLRIHKPRKFPSQVMPYLDEPK